MKKALLVGSVSALLFTAINSAHAASYASSHAANIKTAAYVKTAIDILSYPIAMLSVAAVVGGGLKHTFKSEFIDAKLSSMIGFGTGLGIGALAGIAFRACYLKAHKLLGFTDQEIEAISAESYAQQLWILAQAGSVALFLFEYENAQKERIRREAERRSPQIFIIN